MFTSTSLYLVVADGSMTEWLDDHPGGSEIITVSLSSLCIWAHAYPLVQQVQGRDTDI
jgi:hypothetical protein